MTSRRGVLARVAPLIAVLGLHPAPLSASPGGSPGEEAELRKLVLDYLSAPAEPLRAEIADKLRFASTGSLQRLLVPMLKLDDKRPLAIDLAVRLRVPGLFEHVRKHIDSSDQEAILRLLFLTQDKGALAFLYDRWARATEGSNTLRLVDEAFRQNEIFDVETLDRFEATMTREGAPAGVRLRARDILRLQMGVDCFDREELLAAWRPYRAAFVRDSRPFAIAGDDLLLMEGWDRSGVRRVGNNWRLRPEGRLALKVLPPRIQSGDFTLKFRVLCDVPDGVSIALREWKCEARGGEWIVRSSLGTFCVPIRLGEWQEIAFSVADISPRGSRDKRRISISVDRKSLGTDRGWLDGVVSGLVIDAPKGGAVVSGIEWLDR